MKYIWINPVVDSMYERNSLDTALRKQNYIRVECETAWGQIVKDKYEQLLKSTEDVIADARCPVAANKIKNEYQEEGLQVADIEPILIHCAREISTRNELRGYEKVITTPCRALADVGNELALHETVFIAWNDLERILNTQLEPNSLDASPIPPGFFNELNIKSDSISGEEEIEEYFHGNQWRKTRLVEMLYCTQGCHNGDGVCDNE